MDDDEKMSPEDAQSIGAKQASILHNIKKSYSEAKVIRQFYPSEKNLDDDYSWGTSINKSSLYESVSKSDSERNFLRQSNRELTAQKESAEGALDKVTDGNEAMQRALIQIDPKNIRYIKKPYVSIQMEAITANPDSFHCINHAAQEVIDAYRIIK